MAESKAEERDEDGNCFQAAKRRKELVTDLKSMVNSPESSDVTFKCNDGIRVHASRLLLGSRCSVLKSMLSNGMMESNMAEVPLPKFASPVILGVFEYLYTGIIESYCPLSWKVGFEMISAAQFFIIPAVEEFAHDYLWGQINETTQKAVLMEMLSTAMDFEEDWDGKSDILLQIVRLIGPNWSDEACCRKLSRKAVEYIVDVTPEEDCRSGECDLMVEEYFILRNIVLWHVYQAMEVLSEEMKAALEKSLPGGDHFSLWRTISKVQVDVDSMLSSKLTPTDSPSSVATVRSFLEALADKESLEQALDLIDLTLIPAPVMMKVIYPLNIIPSQKVMKVLLCNAMNRRALARFNWKHGPALKIGTDGQITCTSQSRDGRGLGIAFNVSPGSSDLFEWAFEILEDDADHLQVGFVCGSSGQDAWDDVRLKGNLWNLSSSRILCISGRDKKTYVSRQNPLQFWDGWERFKTNVPVHSVVNFQLNLLEKTCQVRFGDAFQALWEGLPDGDYYPAVAFNKCKSARVRLKIAGGFEFFSSQG